jgi:hypothetical protein
LALASGCDSDSSPGREPEDGPWAGIGTGIRVSPDLAALTARRYVLAVAGGASPFAMALQAPEVTDAVGRQRMASTLEGATAALVGARARPNTVNERGRRAEVEVQVAGPSIKPKRYRFVLVTRAGRWLVAGDTLTRRALSELAPARVVRRYEAAAKRAGGL